MKGEDRGWGSLAQAQGRRIWFLDKWETPGGRVRDRGKEQNRRVMAEMERQRGKCSEERKWVTERGRQTWAGGERETERDGKRQMERRAREGKG